MPAIDGLSEVAGRAAQAEATARSVTWQDQNGIDAAAKKVDKSLAQDRIALARPGLSAVAPSETWRVRLAELVDPDRDAADRAAAGGPRAGRRAGRGGRRCSGRGRPAFADRGPSGRPPSQKCGAASG